MSSRNDRAGVSLGEVTHLIEEAENLMVDREGWVLLSVSLTGGQFEDQPDGLMRLQPRYAGSRMSQVLVQASRCLAESGLLHPRQRSD